MPDCHGMTLVEQLSVLAIISILTAASLGSISIFESLHADSVTRDVQQFVHFARSEALSKQRSVFICPSQDGASCSRPWAQRLIAYHDLNDDQVLDSGDTVLRTLNLSPAKTRIKWRAFGNRSYLQFVPSGLTNYHNGTFTLCPASNDPLLARNIILNVAGRSYQGKDRNGNGVRESASGVDISCI